MPGQICEIILWPTAHQGGETLNFIRLKRCHYQPGIAAQIEAVCVIQTRLLRIQMGDWRETAVLQHHRFAHRQQRGAQQ
ncbi:hypothetical protein D3C71_1824980 [compost metagenome]